MLTIYILVNKRSQRRLRVQTVGWVMNPAASGRSFSRGVYYPAAEQLTAAEVLQNLDEKGEK